ncbi:FMN reductase [Leekyejoonella antrihumi]|uniref:NADPH-dependent FMN reductase-like domain-containing protein n=1 Tax=Leekyejoonella antrihumi TaxID=1660198 RepID=A0A563DUV8_9MICO|nr:FMN reductase [Leekyejoonella antrihumi]TWP34047.1 hypothetical protein FGL98_18945 [Leekyejoonella antrihumi]
MTRRVVAVTAGLSVPSSTRLLTDRLVVALESQLGARGEGAEVEVVELREHAQAIASDLTSGFASTSLGAVIDQVETADALIAVTPVFAASYGGLFKSFFDLIDPESLGGTPVLVAATAGTARHSLMLEHAMRPLFTYLHAVVLPTAVFAATDDFAGDDLARRIERGAGELADALVGRGDWLVGLRPGRTERELSLDDVPDFRSLLGDQGIRRRPARTSPAG